MPVDRSNLTRIVRDAWSDAFHDPPDNHRDRSQAWVDALARKFQCHYTMSSRHRVFWIRNHSNKTHFGLSELLFDITVCSVSTTLSLQRPRRELEFIADCHWQIESEFDDQSTRAVVVDMSKLVLGAAENKLISAAHRPEADRRREILDQCAEIAARCPGNVFFAFVAHPRHWTDQPPDPLVYEWSADDWRECLTATTPPSTGSGDMPRTSG